ncbi:hypothetical protein HQ560_17970 [bacterium]|nr:hypothetical protein [bacterium]
MDLDERVREGEAPAEPQTPPSDCEPKTPGRACRLPDKRCLPCIPCYLFSVVFFVLVLVVLWFALRG